MKLQHLNKTKTRFLLLTVFFLITAVECHAAIRIKKVAPFANVVDDSLKVKKSKQATISTRQHVSFFQKLVLAHQMNKRHLAMQRIEDRIKKNRESRELDNNNTSGRISIISAGVSLIAISIFIALFTTGAGLVLITLGFFGLVSSILAVLFGAKGIGHDKKRGMASAGLAIGIAELIIACAAGLGYLLLAITFGF